tara:strand:- start:38 stop:478 length:441 start_codon:yes stop_codon:yes gene_type:complete
MAYKGSYKVKNLSKYKGDPTKVVYRSLWERKFMMYCDENTNVLKWSSEEIVIPYRSPVDRKMHRYFPDFWIQIRNSQGIKEGILIEVKPKAQTSPPRKKSRVTKRYLREVYTYGINEAKWKAAEEFCKDHGWKFQILTEEHLFNNK